MSSVKLVCFDMDGVIYSSEPIIEAAFQQGIARWGEESGQPITVPGKEEILEQIGKPIPDIFLNLFPEKNEQQRREIAESVQVVLDKMVAEKGGDLIPGARFALQEVRRRGIKVGLASNGRESYLRSIMETYDLQQYFDALVFTGGDLPGKGDLVRWYMEKFSAEPSETVMVGDRLTDYHAAKENSARFVLVTAGHGNDFTDEPVEHSIEDLHNLPELV